MELQIQDLVNSIKKEGIDAANKEAAKIIAEAQAKADEIVKKAKADADRTYDDSKKEIDILRQSASVSAQQARRDAVLSFKSEIENQFKRILAQDVKKTLDTDALVNIIKAAVSGEDVSKLNVEVSKVSDALKAQLADEINKGLEIKPVKDISCGFRVASKDGSGYFDCTDEEIADMLVPFFGNMSV